MSETRGGGRRGRWAFVAIPVAALVVAIGTAFAIAEFGAYADARRQTQLVLARAHQAADRLRLAEEQARSIGAPTLEATEQLRAALDSALGELLRLDPDGDASDRVVEAAEQYADNALEHLRLRQSSPADADEWDEERSGPSHRELGEAIFLSSAFYDAQADRALQRARWGSLAAIALMGLLVGLLALLFSRARRAEELRLAEQRARSEAHFRALVQNSFDVVAVLGVDGRMRYVSPSIRRVMGFEPEHWLGKPVAEMVHPDDAQQAEGDLGKVLNHPEGPVSDQLRVRHADGSSRWIELTATNMLADPALAGIVLNFRDVSAARALQEQLRHQTLHDPLTQLANRALFRNLVQHALAAADRQKQPPAVLYLDLDGFKAINDTLGHEAGDKLLVEVADRLRASVRADDTPARLGGDEFAVLLDRADAAAAEQVADRILAALALPVSLGAQQATIGASVGTALATVGLGDPDELIRRADIAMYFAKQQGKGRALCFEESMLRRSRRRLDVAADLEQALSRGDFVVHYQPIVSLDDGRLIGLESLVRWRDPDGPGLLLPGEFLPAAEASGLSVPLCRWVLRRACHQAALWQSHFPSDPPLHLSVNLSARQLRDPGLPATVTEILAETGLPAGSLVFEVGEAVLSVDPDVMVERLRALKRLGVQLAIHNFGGDQSALRYLRLLPLDLVKIDRSLVEGLSPGGLDAPLLSGVLNLARSLALRTVAEGVATPAQAAGLLELGCELGQGYSLGRPLEAHAIEEILRLAAAEAAPERPAAADRKAS